MFEIKNNARRYLLNNDCDFYFQKPKTSFVKKGVSYSGAKICNDLTHELKQHHLSLQRFKAMLQDKCL